MNNGLITTHHAAPAHGRIDSTVAQRIAWRAIVRDPFALVVELAWRWTFAVAALGVFLAFAARLRDAFAVSGADELALGSGDPLQQTEALARVFAAALPEVAHVAAIATPVIVLIWIFVSTIGRRIVLHRLRVAISAEQATLPMNLIAKAPAFSTMLALHASRAFLLLVPLCGYIGGSLIAQRMVASAGDSVTAARLGSAAMFFLALFVASSIVWMLTHFVAALATCVAALQPSRTLDALAIAANESTTSARRYFAVAAQNGVVRSVAALLITLLSLLGIPLGSFSPAMAITYLCALTVAYCVISDALLLVRTGAYMLIASLDCVSEKQ